MSPNDPVSHDNMCSVPRLQNSQEGKMLRFSDRQIPRHTLSCLQFNGCVTTSRLLKCSRSLFSPLLNGSSSNPLKFGSVKALFINKALSKASELLWVTCVCTCANCTGMYG